MAESNRKPVEFVVGAKDSEALAAFARVTAKLEGMMAPIRRVQDALNKPLNQAGLGQLTNKLVNLRAAMSAVPVAGTLFATGGITAATAALIRNSTAAVDSVSKIQDLSDAYKISTNSLQVFTEVGADSGVMQEEIAKSIGFFQQKIAGARSGEAGALEFMAKIGVDTKTLQKDLPSIMERVANVFRDSTKDTDDALKVDLAKGGFGKGGAQMIAVLERGGGEIKKVYDRMLAEGRIFSKEEISGIDEIGDAWGATVRRFDHFKKVIGLGMTPMLKSISDAFDKFMASDSKPQMVETFKQIGESIGAAIPRIVADLPDLISGLATVFRWLDAIGRKVGWDRIFLGLSFMVASPFLASIFVLGKGLALASVGLIKFAYGLGILAYGAIAKFMVATGGLVGFFTAIGFPMIAVIGMFAAIALAVAGLAFLIYSNWGGLKAFAEGVWIGFVEAMQPVKAAFEPVMQMLNETLGEFSKALGIASDDMTEMEGGFARWQTAGQAAGEKIAAIMKIVLTPMAALVDLMRLLGSSWDYLNGKGFNFNSMVGTLWRAPVNQSAAESRRLGESGPSISTARQDFSGRVDLSVTDDRVLIRKMDSYGGLDLTASSGSMYRTGP